MPMLTWVPEAALKGSAILIAAWLATRLLRQQPAALRHLAWTLALGAVLVMPLATAASPVRLPVTWPVASTGAVPTDPTTQSETSPTAESSSGTQVPSPVIEGSFEQDDAIASASAPARSPMQWALLAWLAGVAVLSVRFLAGLVTIARLRRQSTTDERLLEAVEVVSGRVGLRSTPHLVVSPAVGMPCASGWVRPVVMLPDEARSWNDDRLELVLLHELTHIRRGDYLAHVLAEWTRILHWYNPLVWVAARSLRSEAERATDERVVSAGAVASDYAAHLLDIVRGAGAVRVPAPLMPLAHRSEFEGRLLAILEYAGSPRLRPAAVALTGVVALGLTMTVASIGGAAPIDSSGTSTDVTHEADVDGIVPDSYVTREPARPNVPTVATQGSMRDSGSTLAALAGAINDPVPSVRRAVIEALGNSRDSTAVRALMGVLLDDDNAEVRRAAASALGSIEDPMAVPALMEALIRDRDIEVRRYAASALGSIGSERSTGALAQALDGDDDLSVRAEAAEALGSVKDPTGVNALIRALGRESEPSIRVAIIESLDNLDNSRAASAVAGALRDRSAEVRLAAAEALGGFDDRSVVPALQGAARDADAKVRHAVIQALANMEDRRSVDVFAEALRDEDAEVRAAAADGLSNVDNLRTAPPALIRAMNDANDEVRHRAAHALGHIQDPAGLEALIARVTDRNVEVRQAVVEALEEFEEASATAALRTALRDANPDVREAAARALGERTRK